VQAENLAYYRAHLADYTCVAGPRANRPGRILFNAILVNTAKLDLVDSDGFYISYTPERWSLAWDSARVRAVSWAELRLKRGGLSLLHLNTHLDHLGQRARLEGSRLIARQLTRIRRNGMPVILTGDFNSSPVPFFDGNIETPYGVFQMTGFHDTYEAAQAADGRPENTFHGFQGEAFKPDSSLSFLRMDWILYLNGGSPFVKAQSCSIIRDAEPPLYPSDHYPVLATVKIESK
jgi:endonuclease/exonuclease/phosphatase family metal-dependent hydrolase